MSGGAWALCAVTATAGVFGGLTGAGIRRENVHPVILSLAMACTVLAVVAWGQWLVTGRAPW